MAEVDSLSIELTANTQSAESAIDGLIERLNGLKAAVSGASNFNKVAQGIARIAAVASGIDSDAGKRLAKLAAGVTALSKVGDLSNLKGAGKNIASVVNAVNGMGQTGGKGLSGLAEGIRQTNDALGSIKESDVDKLGAIRDTLAGEVSGPMHTSDIANESTAMGGMAKVDVGSGDVAAALGEIGNSAASVGGEFEDLLSKNGELTGEFETLLEDASQNSKALTDIGDSSKFANMSLEEMERTIGSVTEQLQAMAGTAESAGNAVQNAIGGASGPVNNGSYDPVRTGQFDVAERFANFKMAPLEDEFTRASGAAMDLGQSIEYTGATFTRFNSIAWNVGNAASHVAGGFMQMSGIGGFAKDILYGVGNDADTAADKMGGLTKIVQDVGGAFSRYGFAAIPRYFGGQLLGNIQKAAKGFIGLFNSIKRIAMYRAIRTALKLITQGIGEGIKNLYAWSNAANGTFAASMDRIATSSQYMGNSIAAMASPLVDALAPAIDFIVDKFVDMFNTINQIIARLTGKTSYTAAKKVASQWSDASKSASGSAKKAADEIKRTILGFDEINKLTDTNSSSGGGGGGGGGGTSGTNMFEELPIDSAVSSFADSLKAAFMEGNWQELGTLLGGKVNELVDSIDFAGAGQKVGYYINGWFSTKYWTLDTINFTNIGGKIAEFLNNAIAEIDFGIIGQLMVQKLGIIGDLVIGFFENFNWGTAAKKLSAFVKGLYDELAKWFGKHDWSKLGSAIANGLVDFISNIDISGIANSLYEAVSGAFSAGIEMISGFFDGLAERFKKAINWDSLSGSVQSGIKGLMAVLGTASLAVGAILAFSGANLALGIGLMAAGAVSIGTAASLQWDGLSDKVKDKIDGIKAILSVASLVIGAVLAFSGANIPLGLGLLVAGTVGMAGYLGENWDALSQKIGTFVEDIVSVVSKALLLLGIIALVGGNIPLGIGLLLGGAAGLAATQEWDTTEIVGKFTTFFDEIIAKIEAFKEEATKIWNETLEKLGITVDEKSGASEALAELGHVTLPVDLRFGLDINTDQGYVWFTELQQAIKDSLDAGEWIIPLDPTIPPESVEAARQEFYRRLLGDNDSLEFKSETKIDATPGTGFKGLSNNLFELGGIVGANVIVGASPGTGFKNSTTNKMFELGGIVGGSVKVNGTPGAGFTGLSGTNHYTLAGIDDANVNVTPEIDDTSWQEEWDEFAGHPFSVGVIANLQKTGSNWAKAGSVSAWIAGVGGGLAYIIANLQKTGSNWAKAGGVSGWLTSLGAGAASIIANLTSKDSNWKKKGSVTEWLNGAVSLIANLTKEDSNWKKKGGLTKWLDGAASLVANLTKDGSNWKNKGGFTKWFGNGSTPSVTFSASLDKNSPGEIKKAIQASMKNITVSVTPSMGGGKVTLQTKAKGGVFSNGFWRSIPQYATGTTNAGSVFLAGEAGPELVGHVGGRTEVLNQSQLAATMFSAVRNAMNGVRVTGALYNGGSENSEADYDMMYRAMYEAFTDAMAGSNERDREKVQLMRQIAAKEFSTDVSTSAINRAQTRANRRAGVTVAPVGV